MTAERSCPQCGVPLSAEDLEGLCPRCVGRLGFDIDSSIEPTSNESGGGDYREAQETADAVARLRPEEAGDFIAAYKLMEQIGEGGFGSVWIADQVRPVRRRVALKIIKMGMDTKEVIARFEQERQALAMMDHPHIAKVFDAGATKWGRPYFVMELVRGIKITEYCDQAKLPTRERLELFIQVCNAVQHAHQKGIIHRDLKPSNILVTLHDGVPVPKVIDFGVAKATQQQRLSDLTIYTQFQQMIGTPLYMSPEQAEMSGLDIDTRSDIYSLGVLLYELLTGRTPFDPEAMMKAGIEEMRRVIREQEPQKPSTFLSTIALELRTAVAQHRQVEGAKLIALIRGDLDWIAMKALEKDRSRRYDTANEVARDIGRHLASEPVLARPPSHSYRLRRMVRRNRLTVAATGVISAALVLGIVVSTRQAVRAMRAEQEQSALRVQAQESANIAQAEAAKSRQVAAFLKEMLKGVQPAVALGRDTTILREILDKTAEQVGADLAAQPSVEAEVCDTLGSVYGWLGEYAKSAAMHERTLKIRETLFGSESVPAANSLHKIGRCLKLQRRSTEAESFFRRALATRQKLLGTENLAAAESLNDLADVVGAQGKLAEAEALCRQGLELRQHLLGAAHPDVAWSLNSLAGILEAQNRKDEAESAYREALAMDQELFGHEHPHIGHLLSNLAGILEERRDFQGAERLYSQAVPIYNKFVGLEHHYTSGSRTKLARVLIAQDKFLEAEGLYREELALARKRSATDPADVEAKCADLSDVLYNQGKYSEAEMLSREVVESRRDRKAAVKGSESKHEVLRLATLYERGGSIEEALSLLMEAFARWPNDPPTIERITALQAWQGRGGDHAATCRIVLTSATNTNDPVTVSRAVRAYCLLPCSDPDLLQTALTLGRRAVDLGTTHSLLPYFQITRGIAEYRNGNYPGADEALFAAELVAWKTPHVFHHAQFYQSMCRFKQGRLDEARQLFSRAAEQVRVLPADERNPLTSGSSPDDLIVWLAYKEARALLHSGHE